jgi:hypothetical protein
MFGRGGAPNNARRVHEHFIAVDDCEAARCTQRLAAREFPAARVPSRASLPLFPAGKPAFIAGRLSPTSCVSRLTSMQSSMHRFFSNSPRHAWWWTLWTSHLSQRYQH